MLTILLAMIPAALAPGGALAGVQPDQQKVSASSPALPIKQRVTSPRDGAVVSTLTPTITWEHAPAELEQTDGSLVRPTGAPASFNLGVIRDWEIARTSAGTMVYYGLTDRFFRIPDGVLEFNRTYQLVVVSVLGLARTPGDVMIFRTPCSAADLTTVDAGPSDPEYGFPDQAVTNADLVFYVDSWVAEEPAADVATDGAELGDPVQGGPDGLVDAADLVFFVQLWRSGRASPATAP